MKKKGTPVVPAHQVLANTFKEIDAFNINRGILTGKRQRVEEAAAGTTTLGTSESLDLALYELIAIMGNLRVHLLPSCDLISRRLVSLLPSSADYSTPSPVLWDAVATFSAIFGASSSKLITDMIEASLTFPSVREYFATGEDFRGVHKLAEIVCSVGGYVSSTLLQSFANQWAQECSADVRSGDWRKRTEEFCGLVELCSALLMTCRPLPPAMLMLAQLLVSNGGSVVPVSRMAALHRLRNIGRMCCLPEALPYYVPPPEAVDAGRQRHHQTITHHRVPVGDSTVTSKPIETRHVAAFSASTVQTSPKMRPSMQTSTKGSSPALRSAHPALATYAQHEPQSANVAKKGTPKQSPSLHHAAPAAVRSSPKLQSQKVHTPRQHHLDTTMEDIPDIILD